MTTTQREDFGDRAERFMRYYLSEMMLWPVVIVAMLQICAGLALALVLSFRGVLPTALAMTLLAAMSVVVLGRGIARGHRVIPGFIAVAWLGAGALAWLYSLL